MDPALEILAAVSRAIGVEPRKLQRPVLADTDARCVATAMARDPLDGTEIGLFEDDLCALTGAQHAIAVSSGTAGISLALLAAGVLPGDEVIAPALTFVATANAIKHIGATPHFVDSRELDLCMHPFKLRQYLGMGHFERRANGFYNTHTDKPVTACVPVHLLGNTAEVAGIRGLCDAYGLAMIEDATEALGSKSWSGKWAGTLGKAGVFSFNLNKIVTTGGGGAIVTNDQIIASTVRHLANQAKVKHPYLWNHDAIGYNSKMPNLCAALGLSQLRRLSRTLEQKEALWRKYQIAFAEVKSAKLLDTGGNRWLVACILDAHHLDARDVVIEKLQAAGYGCRALFTPLHHFRHFKDCPRHPNLAGADDLHRRVICLPSSLEA